MYTPGQEHHNLLGLLNYHTAKLLCSHSLMSQRQTEAEKEKSKGGIIISLKQSMSPQVQKNQ